MLWQTIQFATCAIIARIEYGKAVSLIPGLKLLYDVAPAITMIDTLYALCHQVLVLVKISCSKKLTRTVAQYPALRNSNADIAMKCAKLLYILRYLFKSCVENIL